MRWIIALRSAILQVKRLQYPRSVFILKYEGRRVSEGVLSGVISFFTFHFATFLILALALGMFGMDFTSAVSGALTSLANVGPGVGSVIGPAGNFSSLDDPEKILLVFGMFIGRLEMLTVFVLFSPAFWREV
jgi:trk system potassium uptake protein TrkH